MGSLIAPALRLHVRAITSSPGHFQISRIVEVEVRQVETTAQANFLGFLALMSYPLVGIVLFMKYPPRWAAAITTIGGHLFLPTNFSVHFVGLPPLEKDVVVSISVLLGCLVVRPRLFRRHAVRGGRYSLFIFAMIIGIYFTVATNPEPLVFGRLLLPGLTSHDAVSLTIKALLSWWPAFTVGRRVYTKVEDLEVLCTVWTVGGLVYSFLIIVELIMSPQLNRWIYGYQPSSFEQALRGGGYRPIVFMGHGLTLSLFMSISFLAAIGLAKARARLFGISYRWFALYLLIILKAVHSAGALVYGIVFGPLLLWAPVRSQARIAMAATILVFSYPVLRFYDLVPVDSIENFFSATLGADRAGSLAYRLTNEGDLLKKAILRPWFGWGSWGRQFTYTSWGKQTALADGEWILVLGGWGFVGFCAMFGFLLTPIFAFAKNKLRQIPHPREAALAAATLFVTVVWILDLLPNSGTPPHMLMTLGALAGIGLSGAPPEDPLRVT